MRSRRIATLFLVFLFTLPIVVAAADSAQRAASEGLFVRTGQLHDGERYVYDLHAYSTYDDEGFHVPAFMDIQMDRVRDHKAADGRSYDVIATHIEQKGDPEDGPRGTIDIFRDVTYYSRVDDGAYVEMIEHAKTLSWDQDDEAPFRHQIDTERRWHGATAPPTLYDGDYPPNERWVNGNLVQQAGMMLLGEALGGSARLAGTVGDVGEWNGETVYDVGWPIYHGSYGTAFGVRCDLFLPTYSYEKTYSEVPAGKVEGRGDQRVWIQPGLALPVVRECDYRYAFDDGRKASLRVVLELTHHARGGEVIPVPTSAHEESIGVSVVEGPLTPMAADPRGAPPGGDFLEVPLVRALDELERTDLREAVEFREASGGFWLKGAEYTIVTTDATRRDDQSPTPVDPPPVSIPTPLGPAGSEEPLGRPEPIPQPTAVAWQVTVSNKEGTSLEFRLTYGRDETGDFVLMDIKRVGEQRLTVTSFKGGSDPATEYDRLPAEMAAFDDLVSAYLFDAGLTLDEWRGNASSRVSIEQDVERGVHAIHFTGPAPTDDENVVETERTFAYDMRRGAPLGSETTVTRSVDRPTNEPPIPQPFAAQAPTIVDRFPAAATASGVALALGLVAMYFWDHLARVVFAPLYAKLRKDDLLDHSARDRIVDHVGSNPGVAVEELRHELGIGYGTIRHHLDTLARNQLVVHRKVGRRRCYFLPGSMDAAEMVAVGVAGTQAAERVVAIVNGEPGLSQREIALRLDVAPSAVRYQAKRLLAHHRVRAEREGRTVRYYPVKTAS